MTESKTSSVYERLRDDVVNGGLKPGERLLELELVRQYNVSRTPVREAIVRLEHDGLVERRGSSIYVRERRPEEVLDIYQVRVYLEGAIANCAAQRRTETDLLFLDAALRRGEAVTDPSAAQREELNQEFHIALAAAAHNLTLEELQGRLTLQVARLPSTTLSHPGRWESALTEHRAIVDAVRRRDSEEAERIARQHMQTAADIRLALIAEELGRGPQPGFGGASVGGARP